MTRKLLRLAGVVLGLAAPLLQAALPPTENLLPADTLAFFAVPDCAAARIATQSAPGWMFWDDASMRPFHDKFMAKWDAQFVAPLERDLGVKVADFMDLPQGQFALAVTANGSNGNDDIPPGFLLLLDARGKSDLLKTNLAVLSRKWTEAGRSLRTETLHGLAFTVVPLTSNDFAGILPKKVPVAELGKEPPKPDKPGELYFAQFQSLLVVGNSLKVIEPVAAHLTGGSVPAIADNPIFAADKLSQLRDNPSYYGWFNGKAFFDLLTQLPPDDNEDSSSLLASMTASKALTALGLTGIRSASFAMRDTRDGSALTIHVSAPESSRTGLLKILALPPKDASVPPFVPADAVKFMRIRLDGKQTWAEVQKMMADLSPGGQTALNSVIGVANAMGQQKNPGFDIRNDLFGNLNDDFITYQKPASGDSLVQLANPPTLFLVAVSNPDAMINVVKTVAGMVSPQDATPEPIEFLGRKIQVLPLRPVAAAPGGSPQPRSLYVSSSGGYVAISTDSSILEDYLRSAEGQSKPLREDPGLMSAMQYLGGAGGGIFGYENQRDTMRITFKVLKNTMASDSMRLVPPALREWFDFSLLPDYDAVSKYFYISAYTGSANSQGITFKVFNPRPPQLN